MKRWGSRLIIISLWVLLFYVLIIDRSLRNMLLIQCTTYPVLAPFLLVLTQVIFALLLLPCSPISVMAGMLWGLNLGFVYSTLATLLSTTITFFVGRFFFSQRSLKLLEFIDLDNIMGSTAFSKIKTVAICQVNPILPGSSLGYAFSLTSISFPYYIIGVVVGTAPLQFLSNYFGALANNNDDIPDVYFFFLIMGFLAALPLSIKLYPMLIKKRGVA